MVFREGVIMVSGGCNDGVREGVIMVSGRV